MLDPMDHADGIADSLALTRDAMMERCGITVAPWTWPGLDNVPQYAVLQDNEILNVFRTEDEAWTFAAELAAELVAGEATS